MPPDWSMTPTRGRSCLASLTGSSPSTRTMPASARRYPSPTSIAVVLPAPLGPSTAVTSPRAAPPDSPINLEAGEHRWRGWRPPVHCGGLPRNPGGRVGKERLKLRSQPPAGADQRRKDRVKLASGLVITVPLGLGQQPRPGLADIAVGFLGDRPDRGRRLAEVTHGKGRVDYGRGALTCPPHRDRRTVPARRPYARAVLPDHGDDAVHQVADPVSELVVGPADQTFPGEVDVTDPRDLAQQPPPDRISAVLIGQLGRVDRGTARLADLSALNGQIVVHDDVRGQRQAGRGPHGRPVHDMEPQDAPADQVP